MAWRKNTPGAALAGAIAALAFAAPASAFETSQTYEQAYGLAYGDMERPFEPGTRDANGNRIVINGRMNDGDSTLPLGLGLANDQDDWRQSQGLAVGNQLNVITNGSFNTVIIDNTQTNTGDQSVVIQGDRQ